MKCVNNTNLENRKYSRNKTWFLKLTYKSCLSNRLDRAKEKNQCIEKLIWHKYLENSTNIKKSKNVQNTTLGTQKTGDKFQYIVT